MLVKDSTQDTQQYLIDQANYQGNCEKVYIVENRDDIIEILKNANVSKTSVTVCGNRTSLTGSSIPVSGWVISTERLNKIIDINPVDCYAIVEPGVTLFELQEAIKPYQLFFPPDPTETSCFIGGMIGTNASGARSFKYGPTRNFIDAFEIVLADGNVLNMERGNYISGDLFELFVSEKNIISFKIPPTYNLPDVKNTVGYYLKKNMDLIDLFVGAEGTLGIITKVKLKLVPSLHSHISLVVFFNSIDDSFIFLNEVRSLSKNNFIEKKNDQIEACLIEFFDQKSLTLLKKNISDIPNNCQAAFWIEQKCATEMEFMEVLSKWEKLITQLDIPMENIWFGTDERDRRKILNMRHMLPIQVNDLVKKRGMTKMGTDIALPHQEFEKYYKLAIKIVEEKNIDYVAFGHFGDSHLHLNMLPYNQEQMNTCKDLYAYLCLESIKRGGTFSAEHGVGKVKKDYLKLMYQNDDINFMKNVKLKFDPNYIMGAGNLF